MIDDLGSISVVPPITSTIDVEKLLEWGKPVSVPTEHGERLVSKARVTEEFWRLWNSKRGELKAAGITVRTWPKGSDNWEACYWRPVPKEELERRAEIIKASSAVDADISIPCPEGYEYLGYQRAGVLFMLKRFGFKRTKKTNTKTNERV